MVLYILVSIISQVVFSLLLVL